MNTDFRGKHKPIPLLKSFSYAITGIITGVKSERNMKIHLIASIFVLGCAFYFSLSRMEWLFILLVIGGMLSLELVNTAIERVVDLITNERHPLAKQAKDLAAGAVFLYALLSVLIGIIIFFPHFKTLFI
jgi:undecaprenol kinase